MTTRTLYRCNWCGVETEAGTNLWHRVLFRSPDFNFVDATRETRLDFCSMSCLAKWADGFVPRPKTADKEGNAP